MNLARRRVCQAIFGVFRGTFVCLTERLAQQNQWVARIRRFRKRPQRRPHLLIRLTKQCVQAPFVRVQVQVRQDAAGCADEEQQAFVANLRPRHAVRFP